VIVVHAMWENRSSGMLHIWVESSHLAAVAPQGSGAKTKQATKTQKKTRTQAEQVQEHPFVLAHHPLQEAIRELFGEFLLAKSEQDEHFEQGRLILRLPSTAKRPLHSPELILEQEDESISPTEWREWEVATLALKPKLALDALLGLPENPPHGVAYGSSLRFWAQAATFTYEQLTRQNFKPSLIENQQDGDVEYRAAWEAILTGEDDERMYQLSTMMPPACWAFIPPEQRLRSLPRQLLSHYLNSTINAFVYDSLAAIDLLPSLPRGRGRKQSAVMTLAEQWLYGLAHDDVVLRGSKEELRTFATMLSSWLNELQAVAAHAPFRTCFRLDPPGIEDGENGKNENTEVGWRVGYFLQANDDRSLLVPADKVWRERSSTLTFLKRQFENPQERLLSDLGKASRLFPTIEESLKTARPQAVRLTTDEAYKFLRESAPLLEQSGFGVLVPPWWNKPATRLRVKLKVKPKAGSKVGSGLLGLDGIVAYDWTVAVGDTTLSESEFENLVNLKMPLIQVRGQWVELRPDEIEAAIAFFQKKRNNGDMTLGEALRLGLGQEQSALGLQVADLEAEGWIRELMDRLSNRVQIANIDQPSSLQGQLRPYQLKGVSWLAFLKQFGFGACLADDMGLGKTIEFISLLLHDREMEISSFKNPTLLICPMSIVGNWQREVERFAPSLSVMIHHGAERLADEAFVEEAKRHDIVITTYALALRDQEQLSTIDWEYVVVDEAQYIKNETAKQTKAIKSIQAKHRIALTGTPVENRLSELWSIMEFLNPHYLGSGTDFRKNFATPIEKYHDAERAEILKRLIQPFVLRRVKTDKTIIQDLPDKMEMNVYCNLTQEQASLYEAVVKEMIEKIEESEGIERRGLVLATLMKLKQVCNHPAQFVGDNSSLPGRSGKLERLEEMLGEVLATSEKALIFTQFAEMGSLLRSHLQETLGCEVLFLHGGTPKKQRDAMVQRFQQERHSPPIFILSLKAGGVGLNLTGANHVFHFDRWWNPAVENQATDRAFRIGQKKNVQVHKFVCVGTLEERINSMIEQKKVLAESIVGSGENWLTEMSTDQLKELFALSREAVGA
jgi:SNF2 family DNA or RNA helicase